MLFALIILFFLYIFINEEKYYFLLIYILISIYHIYIIALLLKSKETQNKIIKSFLYISLFLYLFTYFIIYDPNPFFCLLSFYIFHPNYIKAILIIFIHTYTISLFLNKNLINIQTIKSQPSNVESKILTRYKTYFISPFSELILKNQNYKTIIFSLIIIYLIEIIIFVNRIKIWVYFNKKESTLPNASKGNIKFYITSNVVNIQNIIENYLTELKKLINYLGEKNVIVSIVENGDSTDNTRKYLKEFRYYLLRKNILNKFYLDKVIEDPRKLNNPFEKYSRLRIEYFAKLRNKCMDFLYEIPNIDFKKTIIIFLNDIVFKYEDIINLLSTNNEDYDVACGLDMNDNNFYDRWVSIDLDGSGLKKFFPFFINKEAQDLVVNHKPIRVFSCWNGVIAFKASPLTDRKVLFRYKKNYSLPKYILNNDAKDYYESECTLFNIDLFNAGYTKKYINPDVRVTYKHKYYPQSKYYIPSWKHIFGYFLLYFIGIVRKRNKYMSDFKSNKNYMNSVLLNWYIQYKK